MKSTGIKVIQRSNDEMLNHTEKSYNENIWKEKVNRMITHGAIFYESVPDDVFSYSRFFTVHKIEEGLILLNQFGYSSSLTNSGFKKAFISDGEIFVDGFGVDFTDVIINNKTGRKWLVDNVCSMGYYCYHCFLNYFRK